MRPVGILLLLALVCAGCSREPFADDPARKAQIEARYDLHALEAFIKDTVVSRGSFDGIDLRTAKLGGKWEGTGHFLTNGFWIFAEDARNENKFTLSYNFSPKPIVELECFRMDRSSFVLERIAIVVEHENEHSADKSSQSSGR